ncbi:MAG: hypothetical protein RSB55_09720 [Oscillospiraceae bacterium]
MRRAPVSVAVETVTDTAAIKAAARNMAFRSRAPHEERKAIDRQIAAGDRKIYELPVKRAEARRNAFHGSTRFSALRRMWAVRLVRLPPTSPTPGWR